MEELIQAIREIVREEITAAMANYPIIINVDEPLSRDQLDMLVEQLKRRLSRNTCLPLTWVKSQDRRSNNGDISEVGNVSP